MPTCKNDPSKKYKGTEPSPKGLGWCAHSEKEGKVRKGKDGKEWIVKKVKNGSKRWVKKPSTKIPNDREYKITVSYRSIAYYMFPDYKMINFPKTWIYDGYEDALKSQPKWITTNAYYFGPYKDLKKAKESIIKLFDKYKKNKYISRYVISMKE